MPRWLIVKKYSIYPFLHPSKVLNSARLNRELASIAHRTIANACLMFQEEQNRGKPNWEHLNDELHVLITVEDTENRATLKLERAVDEVKKLLTVVSSFLHRGGIIRFGEIFPPMGRVRT